MKFYFNPLKWGAYPEVNEESITKILVTDYYSQKGIDGRGAYYVLRSDIYGPMGHELIPFEHEEDAQAFQSDHKGKLIIRFQEIKELEVYKLDYSE
jgi:nitrous oxide reductase accessory protein NosL